MSDPLDKLFHNPLSPLSPKSLALSPNIVPVLCGSTGVGKTALGIALAKKIGGEIISADSRQVYKGLSVGTAKPAALEQGIHHHLVDFLDPAQTFNAGDFTKAARQLIADILKRGKRPIVVGGTGLYIHALIEGLAELPKGDPAFRAKMKRLLEKEGAEGLFKRLEKVDPKLCKTIDRKNPVRLIRALEVFELTGKPMSELWGKGSRDKGQGPASSPIPYPFTPFCLTLPRPVLWTRLETRCRAMLESGMIEETEALLKKGIPEDAPAFQSVGYPEVILFLKGKLSRKDLELQLIQKTRQYAKRQDTWFKKRNYPPIA